jgi:two-component system sensor histidine kinase ChiS
LTGNPSPTEGSSAPAEAHADLDEIGRLRARVTELQRERDHLAAAVDILQEVSGSLHFVEILQAISRKLGDHLHLDRCAIFLTGEAGEVRLVASYEDPTIRNLVVDVNRYPELRLALSSGEAVHIPEVSADVGLAGAQHELEQRRVRSILVVPMQWQGAIIGALFVRTSRDTPPLTAGDVSFFGLVASLTAKALRNAHRFETLMQEQQGVASQQRKADVQRIALLGFLRRLLDRYARAENQAWAEALLPRDSDEELERLVAVAMKVLEEEARG